MLFQSKDSTTVSVVEAVAEPYVLECLFGTPGPARWSDGTTRFSQWCFDELDGDGYLRSEREANTFELSLARLMGPPDCQRVGTTVARY